MAHIPVRRVGYPTATATPSFHADNYSGHGGGTFAGKGFSVDLYLNSAPQDQRGFWRHEDAVTFLLRLDATAAKLGARWRVLNNDSSVADDQSLNAAFVSSPGNVFSVTSPQYGRDSAVIGAAITAWQLQCKALAGTSLKALKCMRNCSTGKRIFLQATEHFYRFRNSISPLPSANLFYS
jgi:hypothetical protein